MLSLDISFYNYVRINKEGCDSMFKNNHGVNLNSIRVGELVKLEKELIELDKLVEKTVS